MPVSLETFASPNKDMQTLYLTQSRLEDLNARAFERGYASGIADAAATSAASQDAIHADFAEKLQEINFTHIEARKHVLGSLEPLLKSFADVVLPGLANHNLLAVIIAEATKVGRTLSDGAIVLSVAPENCTALQALIETSNSTSTRFDVFADPDLGSCEAFIRSEQSKKHIDLSAAVKAIGDAIDNFYLLLAEERKNA